MSYSISRLHTKHLRAYYAQGGEASKTAPTTDAELATRSVPELSSLRGKISDEQLYARARAIAYLDKAIADPNAFFGKIKNIAWGQETNEIIANFKQVRQLLLTETDSHKLSDVRIQTYFQGFDAPGDTNLGIFRTNTEVRNLLQKFLSTTPGHLGIISSIFPPEKIKGAVEISAEQIAVKTRIETFLLALGTIPNEYASDIRKANDLLSLNKVDDAIAKLRPVLKNGWNINVNDVVAKATHGETLRAIGNTQEAAKVMSKQGLEELKEGRNSPEQQALLKTIQSDFEREKANKLAEGQKLCIEMINALPANDPLRAKLQSQKTEMISEIASEQAYMAIMDRFIKNSPGGSKGLGKMFEDYNDMRGLYGVLNFSDENKKIATESAVMLASFVLTAGLGAVLSAIAVGARVVATSGALAAAQVSEKANRARKLANTVGNVAKATARGTLNTVSTVAAVGVVGNEALQANKLTRTAGEALKFTTADTLIRAATRSEGEKSSLGFEQFATNLAKNAVMFGAFAGVEKFMNVQVLSRLKTQFNLQNTTKLYALLDLPVLTVGDIAVMQAMHAAETGKLELDMLGVFQGIAFRVGMRGTEGLVQNFPNLAEKFKQKYGDIRDRVRKNQPTPDLVPEGSFHAGGEYAHGAPLEPINPKNTLHLQPENAPKLDGKPKDGDRKIIEGKEYRWSDKAQLWRAKGGETLSQKDVPTAKDAQGNPLLIEYARPAVEMPPRIEGNIHSNEKGLQGKGELHFQNGDKIVGEFTDGNLNGKLTEKQGVYQNSERLEKLSEMKASLESKIGEARTKLDRLNSYTKVKEFNGNLSESSKYMNDAQEGTRLRVKVTGGGMDTPGFATYQKGIDGKWQHVESNISISGNGKEEIFSPRLVRNEWVFSPFHRDIQIIGCEFLRPIDRHTQVLHFDHRIDGVNHQMRVVRYHDGKVAVEVRDGEHFRPIESKEGFIPKEGTDARYKYDQYMTRQQDLFNRGQGVHNVIDTPDSLAKDIANLESKLNQTDALIAKESARPTRPTSETSQGKGTEKGDKKATASEQNDPSKGKDEAKGEAKDKKLPPKEAKEVILDPLSFRREIDEMMKMDDATFQKNFTEMQYRKGQPGNRPHEVEMYEAVAKVRQASDATIISHAQDIIAGNRQFLGSRHPNLGPSNLGQSEKALMIAENAALRNRLSSIIGKVDPEMPKIIENLAKTGDTGPLVTKLTDDLNKPSNLPEDANKPSNLRRFWPLLLIPLSALAFCYNNSDDKSPITLTGKNLDNMTPQEIAELCKQCAQGKLSDIKDRKSETASSILLNNKRREDISKRWMGTNAWRDMIAKFEKYKDTIQSSSNQGDSVVKALDTVISDASVNNVQLLQRCIAMDAVDNMNGQDGILGPNTTKNLLKVINACIDLPKAKVVQTVQPQPQSPPTNPEDLPSPMQGIGSQIV